MIKRNFILLLFLTAFVAPSFCQKRTPKNLPKFDHRFMHFGFLLGLNSANFIVTRLPATSIGADTLLVLEPKKASGFNLGIISALHINEFFSLRFTPNLAFASRSLLYTFTTLNGIKKYKKTIESTLINFPFDVKYKSVRINNFSAYIIAGAAYTLDLASNAGATNNATNPKDIIVKLKRDDYVGQIGFGTDFYLQYFKFGIELKMSYGIRNLLDNDHTAFSTPIDKLRSKMFLLSFTFEG